jgi:hypothetical protein
VRKAKQRELEAEEKAKRDHLERLAEQRFTAEKAERDAKQP